MVPRKARPLAPDLFERVLAYGAMLLLGFVGIALLRGRDEWSTIPATLWFHLLTIVVALILTPAMLLRPRGTRTHRWLGRLWVSAMIATALATFAIRNTNHGGFSVIHILSAWTLIQVPLIIWTARTHRVARHRGAVRGMVTGALLVAGFFTFPFDRLLGHWLFT